MEIEELHTGHRQRMRDKVASDTFEMLKDHEFLESLLYFVIPRYDTNPLAHRLLDSFGTLTNVFLATKEQLMEIDGVNEAVAQFLISLPKLSKRINTSSPSYLDKYMTSIDFAQLFEKYFRDAKEECLYVAFTRENGSLLVCQMLAHGTTGSVKIDARQIVKLALKFNAKNVVLAHNHPHQVCQPSQSDVVSSLTLAIVLDGIDCRLLDHIIFGTDGCASFIYIINSLYDKIKKGVSDIESNIAIEPIDVNRIDLNSIDAFIKISNKN